MSRAADLDRFYSLLAELERQCGGKRTLATSSRASDWPQRGVYFFFEPGELREDGVTPRVVRVGTHGLRPSSSTLWKRLSQHQGTLRGSTPDGGNHRGSVFRLHVGNALLATRPVDDPARLHWAGEPPTTDDARAAEYQLEMAVSAYIRAMPFLWVGISDEPTASSERGTVERGSIALLSNIGRPTIDPASTNWLGHRSNRPSIRLSGLWNVNHVDESPSGAFLEVLARQVAESEG